MGTHNPVVALLIASGQIKGMDEHYKLTPDTNLDVGACTHGMTL